MIYYINTAGDVGGGTQSNDLNGITAIHNSAYAVQIDDATVSSVTNNNSSGVLQIQGLTPNGVNVYGIPIATGTLVFTPTPDATQLANAQQVKIAQLNNSFNASLLSGFPSSADTTSRTYDIDPISMGKWTGILANINSGKITTNITVKDSSGNKVTLTPTQFTQMAADGFTYYNNQEQHLWTLEDDVMAITLTGQTLQQALSAVNAIAW